MRFIKLMASQYPRNRFERFERFLRVFTLPASHFGFFTGVLETVDGRYYEIGPPIAFDNRKDDCICDLSFGRAQIQATEIWIRFFVLDDEGFKLGHQPFYPPVPTVSGDCLVLSYTLSVTG